MLLKDKKGMTLIEIMIVLAILGGLLTIIGGQVTKQLGKARIKEARIHISEIGKALDLFNMDCAFYPDSLDDLVSAPDNCKAWGPDPYQKKLPKDPWGSEFVYEVDGNNYVLISPGPDKTEGSDDDISSEEL